MHGGNKTQASWEAWQYVHTYAIQRVGWTISYKRSQFVWFSTTLPSGGQTTRNKSELIAAFTSMAEVFAGYLKPKQHQVTLPSTTAYTTTTSGMNYSSLKGSLTSELSTLSRSRSCIHSLSQVHQLKPSFSTRSWSSMLNVWYTTVLVH